MCVCYFAPNTFFLPTEIFQVRCYAVYIQYNKQNRGNAMPCHRTGYDMPDIHTRSTKKRKQKKQTIERKKKQKEEVKVS